MSRLKAILGVARAPFLLLPVTLVAAGAGAARWDGALELWPTLGALVGLVALHVAVNAFNEGSDFRTGIDLRTERTPFSGGSGTLPLGLAGRSTALAVAVTGAVIGCGIGVWFLVLYGVAFVPFFVLGAVAVLVYTNVLARIGAGELFAGLGLGALPVLGTAFVQEGRIGPAAVAASLPAFFMTFNLLLLNEFPDERADREGGRRNLVTLAGRRPAAWIYTAAALAVPVSIAVGAWAGALPTACLWAILPSALLAVPLRWALADPGGPVPVPALGANVVWNLATNLVLGGVLFLA